MRPASLVTVCDGRRAAAGLALARQFLHQHPETDAVVVVADARGPLPAAGDVRLVSGHDIAGPDFVVRAATLETDELVWSLVPDGLRAVTYPAVWIAPESELQGPIELPDTATAAVVALAGDLESACQDGFLGVMGDGAAVDWLAATAGREIAHPLDQLAARFPDTVVLRGPCPVTAREVSGTDPLPGVEGGAYDHAIDGTLLGPRLRRLIADARADHVDQLPFDEKGWAALRVWINDAAPDPRAGGLSRLLYEVWSDRLDLQLSYPDLRAHEDREGFLGWAVVHGVEEGEVPEWAVPETPAHLRAHLEVDAIALGVNVAGYFQSELGVGEAARRVVDALDAVHVPLLTVQGPTQPPSRRGHDAASTSTEAAEFPLNLVCVNADGLPRFAREAGEAFFAGHTTIGMWWWELPDFPAALLPAFDHVDEVWVGTRYVQDAISPVSPVPVIRIPLPVEKPTPPALSREQLGLPGGFLVFFAFDHNSVMERKNPIGLIEAFSRAFPADSDASLVIKSINGDSHPQAHARLLRAAADRPDIHVRDGYVSAAERDAMIASCDVYASLHRAEGFGLTLAEALALGRPVVATGWSGNLDFMSEDTAWLVPHAMRRVGAGNAPYSPDSSWAEPDLDAAAAALRDIRDHPEEAARRAAIGADWIASRHALQVVGAAMRARLEILHPGALLRARQHAERMTEPTEHAISAAYARARRTPEEFAPTSVGFGARVARSAVLRLTRPHVENQRAADEAVLTAVDRVADLAEDLRRVMEAERLATAQMTATLMARQRSLERRLAELERGR